MRCTPELGPSLKPLEHRPARHFVSRPSTGVRKLSPRAAGTSCAAPCVATPHGWNCGTPAPHPIVTLTVEPAPALFQDLAPAFDVLLLQGVSHVELVLCFALSYTRELADMESGKRQRAFWKEYARMSSTCGEVRGVRGSYQSADGVGCGKMVASFVAFLLYCFGPMRYGSEVIWNCTDRECLGFTCPINSSQREEHVIFPAKLLQWIH